MSKALQQYKQAIMGGYDPTQAISYDNFMDARLSGLLKQMQQTNNLVEENNLMIGAEERKREEEKLAKKEARMKALREFGDRMEIINQNRSGNPQIAAALQQQMDARKLAEQQRIEAAQRKAQQEEFIKNNPQFEQMIRFNQLFGMDMPQPKKRDSYVAKDGFRYYVDDGARVFPNVTVKEEQSQADIYKENAARIKNIVLKEGPDSKNLTKQEKAFYDDYINKKGIMTLDQVIAAMLGGGNNNQNTPVKYRVINKQYGSLDAEQIIDNAQNYNPSLSREEIIQELISNNIIAE